MERFDAEAIGQWASSIEPWKVVAFMAMCAERMRPNYQQFVKDGGAGDVGALRAGLDAAWTWIESGMASDNIGVLVEACERNTPDTEDHESPYTSAALDAAVSVALVLEMLRRFEPRQATAVAALARDTVDLWVQEARALAVDDPGFEETIMADDLMQAELRSQRESMQELSRSSEPRDRLAASLKRRWANREVGSLRR